MPIINKLKTILLLFSIFFFAHNSTAAGEIGKAYSKMGVNIEGLSDWSRHEMFVDLMKQSRQWGSVDAPWDGVTAVDAMGWPTGDAAVIVKVSGPSAEEPNVPYIQEGIYKLSFQGKATVNGVASPVQIQNLKYNSTTNFSTADVVVPANCSQIMLSFTNTVSGVKKVSLIRPGYRGTGKIFSDEFIKALAPFSTMRFMDYLATNQTMVKNWKDRTTRQSATYSTSKGGAYEDIIALANQTGKDIWINIPVKASDHYISQLATLLKKKLNPEIRVYVEFSNELWNGIFPQTPVNLELAQKEAIAGDTTLTEGKLCTQALFDAGTEPCNKYWASFLRVSKRTVRISEIFAQIYGATAINNQIRPVLATQYGYRAIGERQLSYIQQNKGSPKNFIYAVAGAPYYMLSESLMSSPTLNVNEIIRSYQSSIVNEFLPSFKEGTPYNGGQYTGASQLALARYYGIKSMAYEGGNDHGQHDIAVAAKVASNFDARMNNLMKTYYSQWFGCGNDLFVHFNLSSSYSAWGSWGLVNNIFDLNTSPKYRAVQELSQKPLSEFRCQ